MLKATETSEFELLPENQQDTDVVNLPNAMMNLTLNTDKIDKKFEFWNELPPELKTACINRMGFKERYSIRDTAHAERQLVEDSQKCPLRAVVFGKDLISIVDKYGWNFYSITTSTGSCSEGIPIDKIPYLLNFIWQKCEVQTLKVDQSPFTDKLNFKDIIKSIKKHAPISVSEIDTAQKLNMKLTTVVMEHSWEQLNKLWLLIPSKRVVASKLQKNSRDRLMFELSEHIISHDDKTMFFSTANPTKKIFFSIIKDINKVYIRCFIVPSSATKSDCQKYLRTPL